MSGMGVYACPNCGQIYGANDKLAALIASLGKLEANSRRALALA